MTDFDYSSDCEIKEYVVTLADLPAHIAAQMPKDCIFCGALPHVKYVPDPKLFKNEDTYRLLLHCNGCQADNFWYHSVISAWIIGYDIDREFTKLDLKFYRIYFDEYEFYSFTDTSIYDITPAARIYYRASPIVSDLEPIPYEHDKDTYLDKIKLYETFA